MCIEAVRREANERGLGKLLQMIPLCAQGLLRIVPLEIWLVLLDWRLDILI
jgi:hypothetical protein